MKVDGDHRRGPETARLRLRAGEETDAESVFRLHSNPEVMRYTGEPLWESLEATREALRNYPDWEQYGIGRWMAIDKATETLIGFAGFKFLPELNEVDLGYRFLPEYWGQGLATEAGRACLEYGFDVLNLPRVIGLTLPENTASIRVLEKLGFTRHDPIVQDGQRLEYFALDSQTAAPSSKRE